MPWILLDIALAVLALAVLVLAGLQLWRRVKALGSAVAAAGTRLTEAGDRLAAVQEQGQTERDAPAVPGRPVFSPR